MGGGDGINRAGLREHAEFALGIFREVRGAVVVEYPSDLTVMSAATRLSIEMTSLVAPLSKNRASSVAPGGPLGDQFPSVSQFKSLPLAPLQINCAPAVWLEAAIATSRQPVRQ